MWTGVVYHASQDRFEKPLSSLVFTIRMLTMQIHCAKRTKYAEWRKKNPTRCVYSLMQGKELRKDEDEGEDEDVKG